jgi:diketogulonate reductase-like aldo/keto reductase
MSALDMQAPQPPLLYGTAWKEQDTARCVLDALASGYRALDTANQRRHYDEAGVGRALREAYGAGLVQRDQLFLQTKFTLLRGQDHRLPYDPAAPLATQVHQSFESSLEHLHTQSLDSYVLHGPSVAGQLVDDDWEVWSAMGALHRAGRTRHLGVSNVSLDQLRVLHEGAAIKPSFVQNRCFAAARWDKGVRDYCAEEGIRYQGFSLLTANPQVLGDRRLLAVARRHGMTPPQVVFRFALDVGMLPLTGTTNRTHMEQDLAALQLKLDPAEVTLIENIAVDGGRP